MSESKQQKLYYNSYMLGEEELQDIDKLINKGLKHIELENKGYSDILIGEPKLINEAIEILETLNF